MAPALFLPLVPDVCAVTNAFPHPDLISMPVPTVRVLVLVLVPVVVYCDLRKMSQVLSPTPFVAVRTPLLLTFCFVFSCASCFPKTISRPARLLDAPQEANEAAEAAEEVGPCLSRRGVRRSLRTLCQLHEHQVGWLLDLILRGKFSLFFLFGQCRPSVRRNVPAAWIIYRLAL